MSYADFKNDSGQWVKYFGGRGNCKITLSAKRWYNMRERCKTNFKQVHPTYAACYMSEAFQNFQQFTDWHVVQVGYGVDNYCLDKDLLIEGNKLYSEDTCVLIPHGLNMFISAQHGKDIVGVHVDTRRDEIYASCSVNGKTVRIGSYSTVEAAQEAYFEAKRIEAVNWYKKLSSKEFVTDERVIERLRVLAGI